MNDPYLTQWHPQNYLRQYYLAAEISADERANLHFGSHHFARCGRRFERAVEIGCGPTLHHAALLAPHVDQLFLADYLPENIEEIRKVLDGDPDAHNWTVYFGGLTKNPTETMELLRRKVSGTIHVDVSRPSPLGGLSSFDLVASYYCIECSTGSRVEWEQRLTNVCQLVNPGGVLLLSALRRCEEYHVLDRVFPTASVDEVDFARILPKLGFIEDQIVIEAVPVFEWKGQGFDSICCVWAMKELSL